MKMPYCRATLVANVPMSECGDYEYMARMMGYSGGTLSFRQLVLASDVAPLKKGFWMEPMKIPRKRGGVAFSPRCSIHASSC